MFHGPPPRRPPPPRAYQQSPKNPRPQNQRPPHPTQHPEPSQQSQTPRQKITTDRHSSRRPSPSQQKIVRNYLFRIFDKLGVSTRVELVLYCLQDRPAAQVEMVS